MEITINLETIQDAARDGVEQAVSAAFSSWQLKTEVEKACTVVVQAADIPALVQIELRRVLDERAGDIIRDAVEASAAGLAVAITHAVNNVSVAMAYGLTKGRPTDYDTSGTAAWKAIEAEVLRKREE